VTVIGTYIITHVVLTKIQSPQFLTSSRKFGKIILNAGSLPVEKGPNKN